MAAKPFYQCIKEIKNATMELNRQYARLRNIAVSSLLISVALAIILAIRVKFGDFYKLEITTRFIDSQYIFCLIGCIGVSAIILIRQRALIPCLNKFVSLYNETLKLCNEIVDESDWSSLRKREITDNKRIRVTQTIDEFYKLRDRRLFPSKTEKSLLRKLLFWIRFVQLILMTEVLIYMIYSIIIDLT